MRRLAYLLTAALLCLSVSLAHEQGGTPGRVRLVPKFTPGRVLRYQLDFRTTTQSRRAGLVEDPQGPSELEISWGAVVRVEVLANEPQGAAGVAPLARIRTTYEKSTATIHTDTYDPAAAAIETQYRQLEGRSVRFALDAQGKVSEVEGLEEILSNPKAATAAREWLGQLAGVVGAPGEGIVPGQKWSVQRPVVAAPLAGLVWRTESTYLRDERCRPAGLAGAASAGSPVSRESCAVILTRLEMVQPHPDRDPTPEEYRQHGLRTVGLWRGTGESLSYISLRTGWLVSLTQSGAEEMDITIASADSEARVRYVGQVRSQSQITLLPEASAAVP